jgi:hypothetical protein
MDHGRFTDVLNRTNRVLGFPETGIRGIHAVIHDWEQRIALRRQISHNTHGSGNRAKRTAKTISYHTLQKPFFKI